MRVERSIIHYGNKIPPDSAFTRYLMHTLDDYFLYMSWYLNNLTCKIHVQQKEQLGASTFHSSKYHNALTVV